MAHFVFLLLFALGMIDDFIIGASKVVGDVVRIIRSKDNKVFKSVWFDKKIGIVIAIKNCISFDDVTVLWSNNTRTQIMSKYLEVVACK